MIYICLYDYEISPKRYIRKTYDGDRSRSKILCKHANIHLLKIHILKYSKTKLKGRFSDFHFWTSWSNTAQIYPVIWKRKQTHMKQWFSRYQMSGNEGHWFLKDGKQLGETWTHPQLTYLRESPGCGVRRGARRGQPKSMWSQESGEKRAANISRAEESRMGGSSRGYPLSPLQRTDKSLCMRRNCPQMQKNN